MLNTYINHGAAMLNIIGYIRAGQLINAIKEYRALNGVGLKEAKDACEAIRTALGIVPAHAQPRPEYKVVHRYLDSDELSMYHADDLSDANDYAVGIVNNREVVYVVQIIAKTQVVTTRTLKAA